MEETVNNENNQVVENKAPDYNYLMKEFLEKRKMFYVDKNGNIKLPTYTTRNVSHKVWFDQKDINIKEHTLGYYHNCNIYLYDYKYDIPNVDVNVMMQLTQMFGYVSTINLGLRFNKDKTKHKGILNVYITEIDKYGEYI